MRRECSVALMFIVDAAGQTPYLSVGGSGAVRIRCCVWNSKSSSVVATSLFLIYSNPSSRMLLLDKPK